MNTQANMNTIKNLYSIKDASVYIGTDTSTIEDLIHCGDLPAFGSNKNMIKLVDLDNFIHGVSIENNIKECTHSNISSSMLFKDYFIYYLKSIEGGVHSRTFSNHINISKHIIDELGDYRMEEIDRNVLKTFINGFAKKKYQKGKSYSYYSQSAINKVYDLLNGAISNASDEDGEKLLRINFMSNIKKPQTSRFQDNTYTSLTENEIKKISNIVCDDDMINLWIHIMLYTGARPSEALALNFSNINYDSKTIDIHQTLSQEEFKDPITKKSAAPPKAIITKLKNERANNKNTYQRRTLVVSEYLLSMIKEWENRVKNNSLLMQHKYIHGTENLLFCGKKGQLLRYDDYRKLYSKLLSKHKVSITVFNPYRYRHSYCTHILRQGIDLKTVQMIMGDNSPDMILKVYANMTKSDILNGSEKYSNFMDTMLITS